MEGSQPPLKSLDLDHFLYIRYHDNDSIGVLHNVMYNQAQDNLKKRHTYTDPWGTEAVLVS